MRTLNSWKFACALAALMLAGCVSTPAPVVNHSFGPGQPAAPATPTAGQPAPAGTNSGAQTFGLGSHANGTTTAEGYIVAPGDTLYSIAFANGMDFRELASINNIPPPYTIHPGQVLKLHAAAAGAGTAVAGAKSAAAAPSAPVFEPVTPQADAASGAASTQVAAASATAPTPPSATAPTAPVQPAATPTPPPGATRNVAGITWRWPASGDLINGFQAGGDSTGINIGGKVGNPVRAAASGTVVYSGNGLIGYGELIIIKHNDTYLSAYGHNSKRLVKEGQHVDAGQEIALMGASGAPRVELHFEIRKNGKPVDPANYLPKR